LLNNENIQSIKDKWLSMRYLDYSIEKFKSLLSRPVFSDVLFVMSSSKFMPMSGKFFFILSFNYDGKARFNISISFVVSVK
jgi:hypothetical protein